MNLLITSAASPLALNLADQLAEKHTIRLTERAPVETGYEFFQNGLNHDETIEPLMVGMDAVLHVGEPLPGDDEFARLDYMTRCTYNLLMAAAEAGIKHFLYVGALEVMNGYPANLRVDERWQPKPTPDPFILGKHLGEYTCREFAREQKTKVTVLRVNAQPAVASMDLLAPFEAMASHRNVNSRELAQSVNQALSEQTERWVIRHVVAATYGG